MPAGQYRVGSREKQNNPARVVRLKAYEIAKFETTNDEFAAFVKATGYVTDAERLGNAMVFQPPLPEFRWIRDKTAQWRFPNGVTRGGIEGKGRHPVTSISFNDATAYCKWAKVRLPSLEEWEAAARAGTSGDHFFGEVGKIGEYANIWHGRDHTKADNSDGYVTTAPAGSFKANPWGLYDVYGNVFEFCTGRLPTDKSKATVHARGGSWWCSKNSCSFFNSVDVGGVNPRASFSNQGFRVARDAKG
ncbi:MAG: SUMF1/EgtB/PvdO family nonheme iron enzyme [Fimbriimonadaceae bacterium]|nr:SUMF1/EgtB/PvdO family nonheme iron enzyme [Fimbriimonadaceae bacterium]QYK55539.1 MAG: SUMF1/EgtB/PvdO family nonheme iron enzyme [Fimbriimonadaceae bacterium]